VSARFAICLQNRIQVRQVPHPQNLQLDLLHVMLLIVGHLLCCILKLSNQVSNFGIFLLFGHIEGRLRIRIANSFLLIRRTLVSLLRDPLCLRELIPVYLLCLALLVESVDLVKSVLGFTI
jgi:hypothetical protein